MAPLPEPLVVLLADGADLRVVDSLLAADRLPAMARFSARAATVSFDTPADVVEEAVWPALLSGQPPGDHAASFFRQFDPATMGLRDSREPEIEPWWLHLPDRGSGGLVIEAPQLHPHPDSRADQVCGWNAWSAPHRAVYTSATLRRDLRRFPPAGRPEEFTRAPAEQDERALSDVLVRNALTRGGALAALGSARPFVCAGVHELHAVAHCLAHHYEPGHWHRPDHADPDLVTRPYEAVDLAVAPLLERQDANVVVVLGQGFRPANTAAPHLEVMLAKAGLLHYPGDGGGGGSDDGSGRAQLANRVRSLLPDHVREWLATHLLPPAVQHRLESQAFTDRYDWTRTRVFALPTWTNGYLRVNMAGREASGIVAPEDYDEEVRKVTDLLLAAVDADTGGPLVRAVVPAPTALPGRRADDWPDLIVVWAQDRPVARVRHPALGSWEAPVDPPRFRWSEHSTGGRALLAGPGVRSGARTEADMLGLAPTLLALCGARRPSTMPAEAWSDALA